MSSLIVEANKDLQLTSGIKLSKAKQPEEIGIIQYNHTSDKFEGIVKNTRSFNNSKIVPLSFDIASVADLGCVKIGNNLTISNDGILNATANSISRQKQRVIIVSKAPNTGDFTTIQEAIEQFFGFIQADSSSLDAGLKTLQDNNPGQYPDPSSDNIYIIFVSPGIYEETFSPHEIKLPPHVALIGDSPDTCIIKCKTSKALETNTNSIVSNLTFDLTNADTENGVTSVIGINGNAKENNKFQNLKFISTSFTKPITTIKLEGCSNFIIDKVETIFDSDTTTDNATYKTKNLNNFYITKDSSNNGSIGDIINCKTTIKTFNHAKNALRIDNKCIVTAKSNEFLIEEKNTTSSEGYNSESISCTDSNLELLHSKIECIGFDDSFSTSDDKMLVGLKLESTQSLSSITKSSVDFIHNVANSSYDEIRFDSSDISVSEAALFTYESFIKVSGATNAANNQVFRIINAYEIGSEFVLQLSSNDNLENESGTSNVIVKELYSIKLFSTQVFSSSHSLFVNDSSVANTNDNFRIQIGKSELNGNDPYILNNLLVFNYPHFITVGAKDCDFSTISSAITSIKDATVNKQYIIKVKPGNYYESDVITIPEYVSLIGESESNCTLNFDQNDAGYENNVALMMDSNTEFKNMKINLDLDLKTNATDEAANRVIGIASSNLIKTIIPGTTEGNGNDKTNITIHNINLVIKDTVIKTSIYGFYLFKSTYEAKNINISGTYGNSGTAMSFYGFAQTLGTSTLTDITVKITGTKSNLSNYGCYSDRGTIQLNNPIIELTNTGTKNIGFYADNGDINRDVDSNTISEYTNIIFGGSIKSRGSTDNDALNVDFNSTLIALSVVTEGDNVSFNDSNNTKPNSFLKTLNCFAITRVGDNIQNVTDIDKIGLPTITNDSLHVGDPAGAIGSTATKNVIVGIRTGTKNVKGTRNTLQGVDSGNSIVGHDTNDVGNDNSFYGHDTGNLATGSGNTFMGSNTATVVGTGSLNTVLGKNSGKAITTMNKSTIIGSESVSTSSGEINDAIVVGYDSAKNLNLATNSLDDIIIGNESVNSLVSGLRNVIIGNEAAQNLGASGTDNDNIMIGHESGMNVRTSNNVLIGSQSGQYVNSGTDNTFVGFNTGKGLSGNSNNDASKNVIIGKASADKINSGNQNVIIGAAAAQSITDGNENIIIGSESTSSEGSSGPARSLNTGSKNIIMGTKSAELLTTGSENIVLGSESGKKMVTTSKTIIIGVNSGNELASTSASNAVIIGHEAGQKLTNGSSIIIGNKSGLNANAKDICIIGNEAGKTITGARNTFIGNYTGGVSEDPSNPVDGTDNVLIGTYAGYSITSGSHNVVIGSGDNTGSAGRDLTIGSGNMIFGYLAGRNLNEGNFNVMIGQKAGHLLADSTKSNKNVFIGNYTASNLATGDNNLIIGNSAGCKVQNADGLLFIGQNAGFTSTGGAENVFIGNSAGYENVVGANNSYIGNKSGYKNTENNNTMIGVSSGEYSTSSGNNTFIGYQAGRGKGSTEADNNTADKNTFIGFQSGFNTTTGEENLYIGNKSGFTNDTGSKNVMIGSLTGLNSNSSNNVFIGTVTDTSGTVGVGGNTVSNTTVQGKNNVMIGTNTGVTNTFGAENIFIGSDSGNLNTTGDNNIYIGDNAGRAGTTGDKNINIGKQAGETNETGSTNIIIGNEAGKTMGTDKSNNIIIGNESGQKNNVDSSIFIGPNSGKANLTGSNNIFLGKNTGMVNETSSNNIMIGTNAGSTSNISGTNGENIYIGPSSGSQNRSGVRNIVIGSEAFADSTQGGGMIAIGYQAGKKTGVLSENVGGNTYNNTIIGFEAGSQGDMGINNVLVGAQAGRNVDNPRKFANNLYLGTESGKNSNLAVQSIVIGNANKTGTGGNKNIIIGDSTGDNLGKIRIPVSTVTTISTISHNSINVIIDMPYSTARYYFDDGDNILIQDSDQTNFHDTVIAGIENNITNTKSESHNVTTNGASSQASGITVNLQSALTVKLVIGTVITFENTGILTLTSEAAIGATSLVGNLTVANLVSGEKSISIVSNDKSKIVFTTIFSNSTGQTIASGASIFSLSKLSENTGDLDDSKFSANTLLGHNTGSNITLGSKNVALGPEAFINNKKGKYNNILGTQAGYNVKSDNNTCFGTRAGYSLDAYSNTNNTIATDLTFVSDTNTISSTTTSLSDFNFGTTFEVLGSSNNDGDYVIESSITNSMIVKGIPQIEEIGVPNNVDPNAITVSGDNFNFTNSTITSENFQVISLMSGGRKYTGLGPQTGQNIDPDITTLKKAQMFQISGSKFNDGFYYIDDETDIPLKIRSNIKLLILNANLQPEVFTSSVSIIINNIKVNSVATAGNDFDDILNDNKFFIFFGTNKAQMTTSNDMNYFPITKPYNSNTTSNIKVSNTIIPQENLLSVINDDNIIFTLGLKHTVDNSNEIVSNNFLRFFKKKSNGINIVFTDNNSPVKDTLKLTGNTTNILSHDLSSGFVQISNTVSNNKLIKFDDKNIVNSDLIYDINSNYSIVTETDTNGTNFELASLVTLNKDLKTDLSKGDLITVQLEHTYGLNIERGSFIVDSVLVDGTVNKIFLNTEQFINPITNGIISTQFSNNTINYSTSSQNNIVSSVNIRINKDFQKVNDTYLDTKSNYLNGYDFMFQTGSIQEPLSIDANNNKIITTTLYGFSELVVPVIIEIEYNNDLNYYLVKKNDFPHNVLEVDALSTPVIPAGTFPTKLEGWCQSRTPNDANYTLIQDKTLTFTPDTNNNLLYSFNLSGESGSPWDSTPPNNSEITIPFSTVHSDDSSRNISLTARSAGLKFKYFGVEYDNLNVISNGNIQFNSSNTDFSDSSNSHYSRKQISFLFDDLNPTLGGSIKYGYNATNTILRIAFIQIQKYGNTDSNKTNSVQINLYLTGHTDSGKIEFIYGELNLSTTDNVTIGISNAKSSALVNDFVNYGGSATTTGITHGIGFTYTSTDFLEGKILTFIRAGDGKYSYTLADTNVWSDTAPNSSELNDVTEILSDTDDGTHTISLTNGFEFFGNTRTSLKVDSNGRLIFDGDSYDFSDSIAELKINEQICFLWNDLNPRDSDNGHVKFGYMNDGGNTNAIFVLAFTKIKIYGGSSSNISSVQIRLFLTNSSSSGQIEIIYGALNLSSNSFTIGISDGEGGSNPIPENYEFISEQFESTPQKLNYNCISCYNNSVDFTETLKVTTNDNPNIFRVVGANNNNFKDIKVKSGLNTLQKNCAYLTTDSNINNYNTNDMVISLETNHKHAKGYKKGMFKYLTFTVNASNLNYEKIGSNDIEQRGKFEITSASSDLKEKIATLSFGNLIKVSGTLFRIYSIQFDGTTHTINISPFKTLTLSGDITFTVNMFYSPFINFEKIFNLVGQHSKFLRFSKVRLETETNEINNESVVNSYTDKSFNFTTEGLGTDIYHFITYSAGEYVDQFYNGHTVYLKETVPNEDNPLFLTINATQNKNTDVGISTSITVNSTTEYIAKYSIFKYVEDYTIFIQVADNYEINSTSLNVFIYKYSQQHNTAVTFTDGKKFVKIDRKVWVESGLNLNLVTISTLKHTYAYGDTDVKGFKVYPNDKIHFETGAIFTTNTTMVGNSSIDGVLENSHLVVNSSDNGIYDIDLKRYDDYLISLGTPVVDANGDSEKEKKNINTLPIGFLNTFIDENEIRYQANGWYDDQSGLQYYSYNEIGTISSGNNALPLTHNIPQGTTYHWPLGKMTLDSDAINVGGTQGNDDLTGVIKGIVRDESIGIADISPNLSILDTNIDQLTGNILLTNEEPTYSVYSNSITIENTETSNRTSSHTTLNVTSLSQSLPINTIINFSTTTQGSITLTSIADCNSTTLVGTISGTITANTSSTDVIFGSNDSHIELQNIQLKSSSIFNNRAISLGYLDVFNAPFKFIQPNTFLNVVFNNDSVFDTTITHTDPPNNFNVSVLVEELVNNKKIKIKANSNNYNSNLYTETIYIRYSQGSTGVQTINLGASNSSVGASGIDAKFYNTLHRDLPIGTIITIRNGNQTDGVITLTSKADRGDTSITGNVTATWSINDTTSITIQLPQITLSGTGVLTTSTSLQTISVSATTYILPIGSLIIFDGDTKGSITLTSAASINDTTLTGIVTGTIIKGTTSTNVVRSVSFDTTDKLSISLRFGKPIKTNTRSLSGQIASNRYDFSKFKNIASKFGDTTFDYFDHISGSNSGAVDGDNTINYLLIHKLPILNSKINTANHNYYYDNYKIPDTSFASSDQLISNILEVNVTTTSSFNYQTHTSISISPLSTNLPMGTELFFDESNNEIYIIGEDTLAGSTSLNILNSSTNRNLNSGSVSTKIKLPNTNFIIQTSLSTFYSSGATGISINNSGIYKLTTYLPTGTIIKFRQGDVTLSSPAYPGSSSISVNAISNGLGKGSLSIGIIFPSGHNTSYDYVINSLAFSYPLNTDFATSTNFRNELYDKGNHSWILPLKINDISVTATSDSSGTTLSVSALSHTLPIGTIISFRSSTLTTTVLASVGSTTLTGTITNSITNGEASNSVLLPSDVTTASLLNTNMTFKNAKLRGQYVISTTNSSSQKITKESGSANTFDDLSINDIIQLVNSINIKITTTQSRISTDTTLTVSAISAAMNEGTVIIFQNGKMTLTSAAASSDTTLTGTIVGTISNGEISIVTNDGFYKVKEISDDNKELIIDETFKPLVVGETTTDTGTNIFQIICNVINSSNTSLTDLSLYKPGQKIIVSETTDNNSVYTISSETITTSNSIFLNNDVTNETPKFCKIEKCMFVDETSSITGSSDIDFIKNSDSTLSTITTDSTSYNFLSLVPNQEINISGTTNNNGNFKIGNIVPTATTLRVPISANENNQSAVIKKRITITKLGEAVITTTSSGVVKFHYLDAQGNNTMIGSFTGQYAGLNAYSIHNLFIGNKVGQTNQGSGNIFIGNETGFATSASDGVTTFNNKFAIYKNNFIGVTTNPLIGGDFATGTVGINTINPDTLKAQSNTSYSSDTKLVVNGSVKANAYSPFTGLHIIDISSTSITPSPGMIMISSGTVEFKNIINTLVSCKVSTTDNDKRVYGVYSNKEEVVDDEGNHFTNHYCASVGEGTIFVSNINGNILNGDYITTSILPGYGRNQNEDILRSYTVAKCTETVDWDSLSSDIKYNNVEYKTCRIACTYHCG